MIFWARCKQRVKAGIAAGDGVSVTCPIRSLSRLRERARGAELGGNLENTHVVIFAELARKSGWFHPKN